VALQPQASTPPSSSCSEQMRVRFSHGPEGGEGKGDGWCRSHHCKDMTSGAEVRQRLTQRLGLTPTMRPSLP